ncbi:prospero homeobox protein 2 [Echinops telfairi]|uniref:Prospero homeobox protein 2 n=1 Tax=Echinops telfairi TaxID=9371 RepID=A0ABM0IFC7_ECHTE|nr:prospero homeobox protein 2 [Echinops telfairi]
MDPSTILLSPQSRTCAHLEEPCMEAGRSPAPQDLARVAPFAWSQVPRSGLADPDWFGDEHIQAKRARVETIVQGMCVSPGAPGPGRVLARDGPCSPEKARERKRKQSLPMQQGPPGPGPGQDRASRKGLGGPCVREQLHLLKRQLRHLQAHVLQAAEPRDPVQGPGSFARGRSQPRVQRQNGWCPSPWTGDTDLPRDSGRQLSEGAKHLVSEEVGVLPSGPDAGLQILREELTRAVSQAVDSVLQKVLVDPPGHLAQPDRSSPGQEHAPSGGGSCRDPLRMADPPLGNFSLDKPQDSTRYHGSLRRIPKCYQDPSANCPLTVASHIQGHQIVSQLLGQGAHSCWSAHPPQDMSSQSHAYSQPAPPPWGALRRLPSTLSQQPCSLPFPSTHLEHPPLLPPVKVEQGGLLAVPRAHPFSVVHISFGLNPGHLKKAKLLFFFTRYPSSNLLKACFPDVQFSRGVTSQMIKWFSNFREFYYIQMEKRARQAMSQGVTNPNLLLVLRDSELFRALNTHYNKGDGFQVPDCFLEIASVTLQEFFRAVSTGKDSDPSWKKPIYKIISKLDSDVPEIFKTASYSQELFRS